MRLVGSDQPQWNSRGHFFGAAAEAMRRILVDKARKKSRQKHGGNLQRIGISELDIAIGTEDEKVLLVNEALEKLEAVDPTGAQLIKLRFFAGLPNVQAAKALGIPERTAKRAWAYARAWLYDELNKSL